MWEPVNTYITSALVHEWNIWIRHRGTKTLPRLHKKTFILINFINNCLFFFFRIIQLFPITIENCPLCSAKSRTNANLNCSIIFCDTERATQTQLTFSRALRARETLTSRSQICTAIFPGTGADLLNLQRHAH